MYVLLGGKHWARRVTLAIGWAGRLPALLRGERRLTARQIERLRLAAALELLTASPERASEIRRGLALLRLEPMRADPVEVVREISER